jgi:hypothetical protein
MDEDYSVGIALLKISRSYKKSDENANSEKNPSWPCEPRNHFPSEWVEH